MIFKKIFKSRKVLDNLNEIQKLLMNKTFYISRFIKDNIMENIRYHRKNNLQINKCRRLRVIRNETRLI